MNLLRILLAEDDPFVQSLIQQVTESAGYAVDIAENGKVAIDKLQAQHYDLVLMDILMPVMDGYEATAYIRKNLGNKSNIPIIVVTNLNEIGEAAKCLFIGANTYIAKPFKVEQLLNEIDTLVIN